jgi:DNA polymerase III gamma/tau subunit
MDTILWEKYKSGALAHAILLESDPLTVTTLVDSFAGELNITMSDLLILPSDETIKVAQVRDILKFANMSRATAPIKLIVIPDATKLTPESANAFLKTLEEPPQATHFILGATQLNAILPTIQSRCQIISEVGTVTPKGGAAPLPFSKNKPLSEYFQLAKELATSDQSLIEILNGWLVDLSQQASTKTTLGYQQIILRYLQLAQHNPNRRLFLDNLFVEVYNTN